MVAYSARSPCLGLYNFPSKFIGEGTENENRGLSILELSYSTHRLYSTEVSTCPHGCCAMFTRARMTAAKTLINSQWIRECGTHRGYLQGRDKMGNYIVKKTNTTHFKFSYVQMWVGRHEQKLRTQKGDHESKEKCLKDVGKEKRVNSTYVT